MDLKITKQVEELEKNAAENAMQIGAMKAFMKLNFGGEHTDKLPKLLDGSEKTPLEMLHKIGLHLARMCEGMAQPTGENSLHKHVVSVSLPTKDKAVNKGYQIASDGGYNYRRVLRDGKDDIYYSGWMDCFDWICNER